MLERPYFQVVDGNAQKHLKPKGRLGNVNLFSFQFVILGGPYYRSSLAQASHGVPPTALVLVFEL